SKFKKLFSRKTPRSNSPSAAPSGSQVNFETGRDALGLAVLADGHDPTKIMWLRDLLPSLVDNARILTFGYDANTLKLSEVSHFTLSDHATSLIVELLRMRSDPRVRISP